MQQIISISDKPMDQLLAFIDESDAESLDIQLEPKEVTPITEEQAEYYIRLYKKLKKEQQEAIETAEAYIQKAKDKAEAWLEKREADSAFLKKLCEDKLKSFLEDNLAKNGSKKRSIALIEGTIGFRKQQDNYEYHDEKRTLSYLEENGLKEYINYKPSINKTVLKKAAIVTNGRLYIDGREVPDITVTPRDDKFEIK